MFRNIFKKYFTNGVFANPSNTFQVVQGTGMTVNVSKGYANIEGAVAYEEDIRTLNIEASSTLDRIDRVVLRLNDNIDARKIDLYVIKGTAEQNPKAPILTRNDSVYDLSLATLYINANSTSISQSKITDTRLDSSVCGIVAQAVNGIDTETLYKQIKTDLAEFKDNEQADFVIWSDGRELAFDEWFQTIKGKLSEDIAGSLQNQIDDKIKRKNELGEITTIESVTFSSERSLQNKIKVQIQDLNGNPFMVETTPDNVYISEELKLDEVLDGNIFLLSNEDSYLIIGNINDWIEKGKPKA